MRLPNRRCDSAIMGVERFSEPAGVPDKRLYKLMRCRTVRQTAGVAPVGRFQSILIALAYPDEPSVAM